jgi:3-isopropylmalate/(R)-2-methylmalate dehydratase small subunit
VTPFSGNVLFLDRGDINTDEIIPARYLTELTKAALAPHLLEDLDLPGFTPGVSTAGIQALFSRANFGCGSSREHAPWALEGNGIRLVVAESFARIFRQNMFNCGMLALEQPPQVMAEIFAAFTGRPTRVDTDLAAETFTLTAQGLSRTFAFRLAPFDRALVEAGGWVSYADSRY